MSVEMDKVELKQAWDELINELQGARDAIDNPELFPPESSGRVLAEGYRYLSGFIHHGVERAFHEDADFPVFRNALSMLNKSTIDNPDAIYFYAPIDGRKRYRITANLADCSHWHDGVKKIGQPTAPQYLIFESSTGPLAGDTGSLAELIPGTRTGFGALDCSRLIVGEGGALELLLAPEKPDDYHGNFICTRKPPSKEHPDSGDRYAEYISGRQLFYDWENEQPINLIIEPLDHVGEHPAPISAEKAAANLRRMGAIIRGQMHFWLNFYDKVLNCKGSHGNPEDGKYFFPVNGYNQPNAASSETGGGMSSNIYAGGIFKLDPDEALYIEANFTGTPNYVSFHLGNLWGESPDYGNHQSSLNLQQMYMGEDGVQRWVVAHRDPGVQNWLDTTGLPEGYLSHRWAYSVLPDEADWPTIRAQKIKFDEIGNFFPADMPRVSEGLRRQAISIRQLHLQRRYRSF